MKKIKCFNLYYEHGGDNFFLEKIVTGSFMEMVNTWLYYLQTDFKEGNNIKFFNYLNCRFYLPKYYRFDSLGSAERSSSVGSFLSLINMWKHLMRNTPTFYSESHIINSRKSNFFYGLNNNELPSIFDYLFNIWIEEIDNIRYFQYKQYTYLDEYEKINFLQYLIMKLKGQII